MPKLGRLIVFEGSDGAGKSTISQALTGELRRHGLTVTHLAFPGAEQGTLGQHTYRLHHEPESFGISEPINAVSLQLLHIASHIDLIDRDIVPSLKLGHWIVLDRFWWSTWVYGRAADAPPASLDAMIKLELRHWQGVAPNPLFLVTRNPADPEPDQDAISGLYDELAKRELASYPIHRLANTGSVDEAVNRALEEILGSETNYRA